MKQSETHYSGVLVVTVPERLAPCAADLTNRLGFEVSHRDPATGRIEAGLREIRAQGDVLLAQPVSHYVDRPEGRTS